MPSRFNCAFTISLIALASLPCWNACTVMAAQLPVREIRQQLTSAENADTKLALNTPKPTTVSNLSQDTIDLARQVGMLPGLMQLEEARQSSVSDSSAIKVVALKQDLVYEVLDYAFDVRQSVDNISKEVDKASDKYALLAEKRDRAIRLNSYANLVSGGLTGMVGGSLKLGHVNEIAPNTIDTFEGVVQTVLSLWGLHELKGEHKIESGVPNILATLIEKNTEAEKMFPPSVWLYMNSVPSDSLTGKTRLNDLLQHWKERGFGKLPINRGNNLDRMSKAAGSHMSPHRVTVRVLEDRMAMLADLQTVILGMESNLQELLQFVRGTRSLAQNTR